MSLWLLLCDFIAMSSGILLALIEPINEKLKQSTMDILLEILVLLGIIEDNGDM